MVAHQYIEPTQEVKALRVWMVLEMQQRKDFLTASARDRVTLVLDVFRMFFGCSSDILSTEVLVGLLLALLPVEKELI